MTFNTALAEEVLANFPKAPNASRPRCMCHNLYLEKCPDATQLEKGLEKEVRKAFTNAFSKCKKHRHRSRGKAEAQLRSLLRRQLETNSKGDASTLEVYKCRRVECRDHPWHVGHNPYVRREV